MIRRTRTTVRPTVQAARRLRTVKVQADTTEEIQEQLQLIANLDRQMEDLQRSRAVAIEEITELYKRGSAEVVSDGVYEVRTHTPMGRSTTVIHPQAFKKVAGDEAFWKCCKIGVTEAKTFLSEKELTKVADVLPGKPGKPEVVVEKVKKSKK